MTLLICTVVCFCVGVFITWKVTTMWLDDWWKTLYDKDVASVAAANRRLMAELSELKHK